jgi:pyridoxal 5'-phosphate synthase pdxT subunit
MNNTSENNQIAIGVLALQGAVEKHILMLEQCGVKAVPVRFAKEFDYVDGLIIPGGESTTMGKLMKNNQLDQAIKAKYQQGMAIWGTCAGMILLAQEIVEMDQPVLGLMEIAVVRNGFGRQVDSFETDLDIDGLGKVKGVFIRAPYVERIWGEARVMAYHNEKIVMVEQGRLLGTAFHPELTRDNCIHEYLLKKVCN